MAKMASDDAELYNALYLERFEIFKAGIAYEHKRIEAVLRAEIYQGICSHEENCACCDWLTCKDETHYEFLSVAGMLLDKDFGIGIDVIALINETEPEEATE